jgi:chemotaxis-related protein WspD
MPPELSLLSQDIDDCWNRIGIHGDQSCERLHTHIHCRNCDVYERNAAALLDKIAVSVADGALLRDATGPQAGSLRNKKRVEGEPLLLFRVGDEWFALPARFVSQVAEVSTVHSLPKLRSKAVVGLVNVRGQLTVCVSLAKLLDLSDSQLGRPVEATRDATRSRATARYIVTREVGQERGREKRVDETTVFPVDEVHGIERFSRDTHRAVPATLTHSAAYHTRAVVDWDGHSVGLLDTTLLFETLRRSLG